VDDCDGCFSWQKEVAEKIRKIMLMITFFITVVLGK
jgi:hypothetical protein